MLGFKLRLVPRVLRHELQPERMTSETPAPPYQRGLVAKLVSGLLRLALRLIYRVRVIGHDRVPRTGGALLVCNHLSWVDALLVGFASERHVRFMMFQGTYERWFMKPFARALGIIPISSEQKPREMIKSLQTASGAILAGDLVCIF